MTHPKIKKMLSADVGAAVKDSKAELYAINIQTADKEAIELAKSAVGSVNARITNDLTCISLPNLYNNYRSQLGEYTEVMLMNVTHYLGFTQIESCLINPSECENKTAISAVQSGRVRVSNGEPYYEEDAL